MPSQWALRQRAIRVRSESQVFATAPSQLFAFVDGKHRCKVRSALPHGTPRHPFPHARVDYIGEDSKTLLTTNIVVELHRLQTRRA